LVEWTGVTAGRALSMQLTPEQEQRIQAVVDAGAYSSAEEALNTAVAAVEIVAAPGFEGTQQELDQLLLEGLNSGGSIEADETFWNRLRTKTDEMITEHQTRKPRP